MPVLARLKAGICSRCIAALTCKVKLITPAGGTLRYVVNVVFSLHL